MGRWKDGAHCAVMLTFDVDAETHRAILTSVHDQGHELAHHGWIHELPANLSRAAEEEVLQRGIVALRTITNTDPVGYRSPAWEFSTNTLDLLHEHGFKYSSNMMDHFIPYVHPETDVVELPVQWITDDAPFFLYRSVPGGRSPQTAEHVFQVWSEEFRGIYRYGGLFNLTMHPQIIGRPGRLLMLERFLDYMCGFPGLWFATGREVAEFWSENGERDPIPGFNLTG